MSVERGGSHPEMQRSAEREQLGSFAELRKAAHQQLEKETERRINENSEPTEEEIMIGAFREMIEPQIRDAVFEMARKGYTTESSGFVGENGEIQSLDGYFEVDEESRKKIEALGARVLKRKDTNMPGLSKKYSFIQFEPKEADLEKIKAKLDEIVAILPNRDLPASPTISGHADDFREKFASDRTDIERETLKKKLEFERYHPDVERQIRERLEELELKVDDGEKLEREKKIEEPPEARERSTDLSQSRKSIEDLEAENERLDTEISKVDQKMMNKDYPLRALQESLNNLTVGSGDRRLTSKRTKFLLGLHGKRLEEETKKLNDLKNQVQDIGWFKSLVSPDEVLKQRKLSDDISDQEHAVSKLTQFIYQLKEDFDRYNKEESHIRTDITEVEDGLATDTEYVEINNKRREYVQKKMRQNFSSERP